MQAIHEELGICATIDPIDANNADTSSDIIDMSKWTEVLFVIQLGVLAADATNTVTILSSSASDMTGEAALSGKSADIINTDDAKQFLIRVTSAEVNAAGAGHRYIRATMANSAHSQLTAILALGRARSRPATDDDLSSVQTVVD